jgi:hypothetical protein
MFTQRSSSRGRRGEMKRSPAIALCAAVALGTAMLAASGQPAAAQNRLVYVNDFSQGASGGIAAGKVSANWSTGSVDVTPSGRIFLGQFGNDAVTLTLTGLPPHRAVTLSFKLFAIRSWDGVVGPSERWEFGLVPGTLFLRTSFSNLDGGRQSFPLALASGNSFPARTGALENNTLGYDYFGTPMDSVYQINQTFAHTSNTLTFYFAGTFLEALDNESWGLDDVAVSVLPR